MIHRSSQIIANFLVSNGTIKEEEIEIYIYGYETFISGIFDFIITILLGVVFHKLICAVIFFFMFVSIRMYTGGYHAKTYLKCKLIFVFIAIGVLNLTKFNFSFSVIVATIILFCTIVYLLAPIENIKKPLNKSEKQKYRKISIGYSLTWSTVAIITYFCNKNISTTIISTAFFIMFLMIVGVYGKEDSSNEDEQSGKG